jgi:hypothetical protein
MVESTARKMKIMQILILKMARCFCSKCPRCSLRVYYTDECSRFAERVSRVRDVPGS